MIRMGWLTENHNKVGFGVWQDMETKWYHVNNLDNYSSMSFMNREDAVDYMKWQASYLGHVTSDGSAPEFISERKRLETKYYKKSAQEVDEYFDRLGY